MGLNLRSARVQAIGLRLCESLAKAGNDVASVVAGHGVAAYAVRAVVQHPESSVVVESAAACLRSIASGATTEGAADGVLEALSTLSEAEEFVARWRWLNSLFSVVLDGEALRVKLDTFGTASELKMFSFTASELKVANFTASELHEASFTASELKAVNFTASELKAVNFTASELKVANFTASELKAVNFTASAELRKFYGVRIE